VYIVLKRDSFCISMYIKEAQSRGMPTNMPTLYNVFSLCNIMGCSVLLQKKREKVSLWSKTNKPLERWRPNYSLARCFVLHTCTFPANLLNYHHYFYRLLELSWLKISWSSLIIYIHYWLYIYIYIYIYI
jgi:hypothetical protein